MADRNGWSFCSLVYVRLNDVFHPRKDKIHVAFLYFLDKSELHFRNLINQLTYYKNKTWDTYKDLQSVSVVE